MIGRKSVLSQTCFLNSAGEFAPQHLMKRCPQCGREYDNSMSFCLDDGAELLYGLASEDGAATAILSDPGSGSLSSKLVVCVFSFSCSSV